MLQSIITALAYFMLQVVGSPSTNIYTGFNYGAFWSEQANAKYKADFREGFQLARNLSTPVPFDSARLFTCITTGTTDCPTEAFDAAVETKTKLLLGFWISPAKRGFAPDEQIKNELSALSKGFEKHGQALADVIIGLSVGSEDIYRWEEQKDQSGVSSKNVSAAISNIRKSIASSPYAKYMEGKPIGHVDVAKYAVVEGADFYGITVYPYWNKDGITKASESFDGSLDDVKRRAGNVPIWIAEMGWPAQGPPQGGSVASVDNLQEFWTEVGCSIVGTYTTFWFELLKDTTFEQPDWGFIDIPTKQPRIKDLSCPGGPRPSVSIPVGSSPGPLPPISTVLQPIAPSNTVVPSATTHNSSAATTTHVTTTLFTTIIPRPLTSRTTDRAEIEITTTITSTHYISPPPALTTTVTSTKYITAPAQHEKRASPAPTPWCVTVADIGRNGRLLPIAAGPAGSAA
ncbi:hypothetical protein ACN47E_008462 [Coniothyrium glycines]